MRPSILNSIAFLLCLVAAIVFAVQSRPPDEECWSTCYTEQAPDLTVCALTKGRPEQIKMINPTGLMHAVRVSCDQPTQSPDAGSADARVVVFEGKIECDAEKPCGLWWSPSEPRGL